MAFNVNEDLVRGGDVFLFVGGSGSTNVIAFGTSAQLQADGETISTTNKMSCKWASNLAGTNSYTVTSDSLYTAKSGLTSYDALMKMMLSGDTVDWYLGPVTTSGSSCEAYEYTLDASKPYYHGKALITSLSLNAGNVDEIASCSATLTGSGELKQENVN